MALARGVAFDLPVCGIGSRGIHAHVEQLADGQLSRDGLPRDRPLPPAAIDLLRGQRTVGNKAAVAMLTNTAPPYPTDSCETGKPV